jgi:hypothetical protein
VRSNLTIYFFTEFAKFVPFVTYMCSPPAVCFFTPNGSVLKPKTLEFQELGCLDKTMLPVQASGMDFAVWTANCLWSKVEQDETYYR